MRLHIEHQTQYAYSDVVTYTIQQLRLTPKNGMGQRVHQWDIKVQGQLHAFEDTFGNATHTLVIDQPHETLQIHVMGEVETGLNESEGESRLPVNIFLRDTALTEADPMLLEFAKQHQGQSIEKLMLDLRERMTYIKGATKVDTTAAEAFRLGQGVCQDHAHAFIACCRVLGIPARYVSGYLFTEDGSLMQTHAWADVWQNQAWQSWDVSNGMATNDTHVRLAVGLDYRSASPVSGMRVGGGAEGMASQVMVNQSGFYTHQQRLEMSGGLLNQAQQMQQ